MKQRSLVLILLWTILCTIASSTAFAQMRGGSTGGMGRGQQSSRPMQGPMSQSGTGPMNQSGTQADRRQIMHTTARQDQQFSACQQAMHAVQGDLHGIRPKL